MLAKVKRRKSDFPIDRRERSLLPLVLIVAGFWFAALIIATFLIR
jgi:hypothetical protein